MGRIRFLSLNVICFVAILLVGESMLAQSNPVSTVYATSAAPSPAQTVHPAGSGGTVQSKIVGEIDDSKLVELRGNVPPLAQPKYDQGPIDPNFQLPYIALALKSSAQQEADLEKLLREQQDKSSPNYHRWLTPTQFAARFGPPRHDVDAIVAWIKSKGFTLSSVARSGMWITFTGTAQQVEQTFHTQIHSYLVDGEMHYANAESPSIPGNLEGLVGGIIGLNDFHPRSPRRRTSRTSQDLRGPGPDYTDNSGNHFLAPGDIATIYDVDALFQINIFGSGQTAVVVGQSDVDLSDVSLFQTTFGLSGTTPTTICSLPFLFCPGITDDEREADTDLEWISAVARSATIYYVYSFDAFQAAGYAADNWDLLGFPSVISMSFLYCEPQLAASDLGFYEVLAQLANSEGVTWLAASGDSGAAACDGQGSPVATQGPAVNLPASYPEVTGVGGSEFNEGSGNYWGDTNGVNGGSALSYIPETAWNDTSASSGLTASGGGPSSCATKTILGGCAAGFPKPAWQAGPGVPSDGVRDVPDVALSASLIHDGYIVCEEGTCYYPGVGGTSVSTPIFAGIVLLLNQYLVSEGVQAQAGLGNINPTLYTLAQNATNPFHDVTTGSNVVPCQANSTGCTPTGGSFGYTAGSGYDPVTGLGSVDAYQLVTQWAGKSPLASLSQPSLDFGTTSVGSTSTPQQVTLSNPGGLPLAIFEIQITGQNVADFSINSNPPSCNTSTLLQPSSSCTITILFDPTASGPRAANLTVTDNAADSPQVVTLTGAGSNSGGSTTATLSPTSLNFPAETIGSASKPASASLTNTGSSPLTISTITFGGANPADFTEVNNCGALASGQNCTINVTFTPLAAGTRTATMYVTDNASNSPQSVTLTGGASGTSTSVSVSPSMLNFPNQTTGSSGPSMPVTISNTGAATLNVSSVIFTGFGQLSYSQTNNCSAVAPGQICTINVQFTPQVLGMNSATMNIYGNFAFSPQMVSLTGTGVGPGNTLSVSPTSLSFGNQLTGVQSPPQYFTVTNTGNTLVYLGGIQATANFFLQFSCPAMVPGASCVIAVTFLPPESKPGQINGTVTITDSAAGSPQKVTLSGVGVSPNSGTTVSVTPTSLTFPSQFLGGQSLPLSVTVLNNGTGLVYVTTAAFTGSGAGNYSASNNCPGNGLPTRATCVITVTFTPHSLGLSSATLQIYDNASGSPQTVAVSGIGGNGGSVSIVPTSLTFANQTLGVPSQPSQITMTNTSNSEISFWSLVPSGAAPGDFYFSWQSCGVLDPGQSCIFDVFFQPTALGARNATVEIWDTANGSPQTVPVSGTGVIPVLSPSTVNFGSQNVGSTSSPMTLSVSNPSASSLGIQSVTLAGLDPGDFFQTNTCGTSLAAGATCTITLTFTPGAAYTRSATVVLSSVSSGSPQTALLMGTGVPPAIPEPQLSAQSLSFGSQAVGTTSAPQTVVLSNQGGVALNISNIGVTGANSGDFIESNNCPASLSPANGCAITVSFGPSAAGNRAAAVAVTDNATGSPQMITLSGTGTASVPIVPQIYVPLVPDAKPPGSAGFTLTINGFGFVPESTASWNGSPRPTTFVSSSQLIATIYAADVSAPMTASVTVTSSTSESASNVAYFSVTQPTSTVAFTSTDNSTAAQPESVVAADFNGDGKLDLAAASYLGFVSVMLGNGDGTFQGHVDYPVGAGARSVVVGDFNGDGILDLAVANQTANTVSILLGNADGTFQGHVDYPAGTDPFSLAAGDFKGSGVLDLAVVNQSENEVTILLGNGDGTFEAGGTYSTGKLPFGIVTADFNGDGNLDLAVANYTDSTVSILLGDGDGTFQQHTDYPTSQSPEMLVTADFNGDGRLDLAVGTNQATAAEVSVLLGNGDGTFQPHADFPAGSKPRSVIPADLNGDGKLDLAIANYGSSTVSLLIGNGAGGFTPQPGHFSTGPSPQSITVGSFKGNGRLDLATADYGSNMATVLLESPATVTVTLSPASLSFGNQAVNTTSAAKTVTLTNTGTVSLTMNSITPSSDFAVASTTCGTTLAAGAKCTVSVTFTPPVTGALSGTLTFNDNAANSPQTVSLTGTGEAQVTWAPTSLTFAKQAVETTSAAKNVTLTNNLPTALSMTSITFTGTDAGDFAQTNTCDSSVPSKGKCTISVTFTPKATGTRTATLNVNDSANNNPQIVSLEGAGIVDAVLTPDSAIYSAQKLGTTSVAKAFTLTNNQPVALTSVAISTTGDFGVSATTCGASLAAKAKCTVSVVFKPTATGTRAGQLSISDSASNSPQTSNLKGTGK